MEHPEVKIVPYKPFGIRTCWYKVKVKTVLLNLFRIKLYYWRTIYDACNVVEAKAVASNAVEAMTYTPVENAK